MKILNLVLALGFTMSAGSALARNNDVAMSVCNSIGDAGYPTSASNCRKIAQKGDFDVNAVGLCAADPISTVPFDRVPCIEAIRDHAFDVNAVAFCAAKYDNVVGAMGDRIKCLQIIEDKMIDPAVIANTKMTLAELATHLAPIGGSFNGGNGSDVAAFKRDLARRLADVMDEIQSGRTFRAQTDLGAIINELNR